MCDAVRLYAFARCCFSCVLLYGLPCDLAALVVFCVVFFVFDVFVVLEFGWIFCGMLLGLFGFSVLGD